MKLECTFCKSTDPDMNPFRWGDDMYCSYQCWSSHKAMSEMKERTGLIACFFYKIMVISRYIYRLIKIFRRK